MADVKISIEELNDPRIDDLVNLEKAMQKKTSSEYVEDVPTPFIFNPIFYYSVATTLGSFVMWFFVEPLYANNSGLNNLPFVSDYLVFGPVASAIGLSIGLVYGWSNRNLKQAAICGAIGLGVGAVATIITTFIASIVFNIFIQIAAGAIKNNPVAGEYPIRGLGFFILLCGRGVAWAIVAIGSGIGLGVALKSKKLLLNGLVGGMIGGALGGMLFDPIERLLYESFDDASISRAVGCIAVGLLVGIFVGIFENISKDSWLLMVKGPLAGKQFNIYKNPMVIGSAPSCDIYLFKDSAIDPRHATIKKSGNKYLLNLELRTKVLLVNGRQVDSHVLQPDDVITIGKTVLKYQEKKKN